MLYCLVFISEISRKAENKVMMKAFSSFSDKNKLKNAVCVAIDTVGSRFAFYAVTAGDIGTLSTASKPYKNKIYTEEFLTELTDAVRSYVTENPPAAELNVTLLVPDKAVMMDTLNVPNISKKRNEDALEATITGIYKNKDDLRINRYLAAQSKHVTTYSLSIIRDEIYDALTSAMTEGGLTPNCVTFHSNGIADAISVLVPKLRTASYLLLDMKEQNSDFVFVAKGRTTGFFPLPFGYSALKKSRVCSEDMLFDHSFAELAVLNAKEKARAKQLTIMREENVTEDSDADEKLDAMFGNDENSTADPTANVVNTYKTLPKKEPRKLPKFMQRPLPRNEEEFVYENFRIFIKWALNLIQSNDKLSQQGKPESVVVNMPEEFEFLYAMTNAEAEENGIEFQPLELHGISKDICENLQFVGGVFAPMYNRTNNF